MVFPSNPEHSEIPNILVLRSLSKDRHLFSSRCRVVGRQKNEVEANIARKLHTHAGKKRGNLDGEPAASKSYQALLYQQSSLRGGRPTGLHYRHSKTNSTSHSDIYIHLRESLKTPTATANQENAASLIGQSANTPYQSSSTRRYTH